MTQWNKVLSKPVGQNAIRMFAEGNLSCENVQKVFRNNDKEASGQVRSLIREKGTAEARKIARKALRRRGIKV